MRQRPVINFLYQNTSALRPLDIFYPTNLAIMTLMLIGGLIASFILQSRGVPSSEVSRAAVNIALQSFMGWVIAREIDPDHELSAFAAAGLAFIGALLAPQSASLTIFVPLVVLTRILNRIVGLPARIIDSLAGLCLTGLAVFNGEWMFGLVGVAVFGLDAILEKPLRIQWLFAGITALLTGGYIVTHTIMPFGEFSVPIIGAALVLTLLYGTNIATTRHIETRTDYTNEPLSITRVQATMAVTLLTVIVYLWNGDAGFWAMLPLWMTLVATSLWRMLRLPNPSFAIKSETK